ncbi:MAG: GNAT family N-acetyltransferase [Myxococcales bacterium]|nr:GNAT family N-acetyltransferase [Myxococcales bacterium]|tara:strand:+ start:304 stop:879 length:576 start_codon:yes stop_codon:yes gene_type:complete
MATITPTTHTLKDGRQLTLRSGIPTDAEAEQILKVVHTILAENTYTLVTAEELTIPVEQEKEWIKAHLEHPHHLLLVAELEGQIVGSIDFTNGVHQRIAHTGEFGMGVAKAYRGLGVGQALLVELMAWAKSSPMIKKINLCVHHTNTKAIAMYEKHGFVKEGLRTKDLKYSDTEYVDTVLMGLWLDTTFQG